MTASTLNLVCPLRLYGFGLFFSCFNLRGKCEGVSEEQVREAGNLLNLCSGQFLFVMGALIAIEPNDVSPLLQVARELPRRMQGINPRRQILACERWIEFPCRHVQCFAIHRSSRIRMSAFSIVRSLLVGALNSCGNMLRNFDSLRRWVDLFDGRAMASAERTEFAVVLSNPCEVCGAILSRYANQIVTSIATENDGRVHTSRGGNRQIGHPNGRGQTMGARIHEGGGHE
jgi:hypothetical protein